jgi:hypothetical protein
MPRPSMRAPLHTITAPSRSDAEHCIEKTCPPVPPTAAAIGRPVAAWTARVRVTGSQASARRGIVMASFSFEDQGLMLLAYGPCVWIRNYCFRLNVLRVGTLFCLTAGMERDHCHHAADHSPYERPNGTESLGKTLTLSSA